MVKSAELIIVKKKIAELIPNPKNPNTHDERQINKLSHSIKKHGFVKGSVVIQKSTSTIIAGHGIIEALKKLGYDEVDVIEADLTDEQADAFLIADNHIASQSVIDDISLQKLINELSDLNVPAIDFGFDQDDLDALAGRILAWNPKEKEMPDLPEGDRQPFQQMTFILTDDQVDIVKKALQLAKDNGGFSNTINENSNGNALARIAEAYLG